MGCAATKVPDADAARSDFSREPGLPPVHQEQLDDWMQASNLPTLTQDQLDDSMEAWNEYDGALIETELRVDEELGGSPVRLIDARFLVQLAEQGGIFIRRQDLPETAFLSLDTIKRLPKGGESGDCLRVISISHPWQHPDHPDQKSINLKLLARVLKAFVEHRGGTYAVFLDVRSPRTRSRLHTDAAAKSLLTHPLVPTLAPTFDAVSVAHPEGAQRRGPLEAGRCPLWPCTWHHDGVVLPPQDSHTEAHQAAARLPKRLHLPKGHHAQHSKLL